MSEPVKILLVDSNPVVRLGLGRLLWADGMEIVEACLGQEALQLARKEAPDMAVVDDLLPDMSGREVCRKIRSDPLTAGMLLVLLCPEASGAETQEGGFQAGADWCISTPIGNRDLRARLRAMLRMRRSEALLRQTQQELDLQVQERTAALSAANAALRQLSQKLVAVQESERRALARELHDEIGQTLTSLKLSLSLARRAAPAADALLEEPLRIIDDLMARVRRMSLDLRPQLLDDLGLLVALEWHFERFTRQTGVRVHFQGPALTERLPTHLETAIFRTIQEALNNIAKHAHVEQGQVRMAREQDRIAVEIRDTGRGFDLGKFHLAQSAGLSGMRERADLLGGSFSLETAEGKGTRVHVTFPLPQDKSLPAVP